MKQIRTIAGIVFALLSLGGLHAQESINTSGGEATGVGGLASYSVGQVFYNTVSSTDGSVAPGVQQPYELELIGIKETGSQFEINIFPNPTTNYLTLTTGDNSHFSYQLYDIQGRIIVENEVFSANTNIDFGGLPAATYFLKVSKSPQAIKTFKIIKN